MNRSWSCRTLGSLLFLCVFIAAALPSGARAASEAGAINPDTGKKFGVVWRIRGDVVAAPGGAGGERHLKEGDAVFVGERIRADAAAEAALKTEDAGVIGIRPGAEFLAEHFSAAGKSSDSLTVRLLTGSLRVITGWIGRTNRAGQRVKDAIP